MSIPLSGIGVNRQLAGIQAAAAALAGLSQIKGDPIGELVKSTTRSIAKDPQGAAELAAKATKLGAAILNASATLQEEGLPFIQPSVSESTTTKKEEVGADGRRKVTITTTTKEEKNYDPKTEIARLRLAANIIEQFGAGLPDGKIEIGGQIVTFDQLRNLAKSVDTFSQAGKQSTAGLDVFITLLGPGGVESIFGKSPETTQPETGKKEDTGGANVNDLKYYDPQPTNAELDATTLAHVTSGVKSILTPEQLDSLRQLASAFTSEQLGAILKEVAKPNAQPGPAKPDEKPPEGPGPQTAA